MFSADDVTKHIGHCAGSPQNTLPLFLFLLGECVQLEGAIYCTRKPFRFDGFEQIGKRVGFKSSKRMLIVAGDEDDQRQWNARTNRPQYIKTCEAWHLDIQKE